MPSVEGFVKYIVDSELYSKSECKQLVADVFANAKKKNAETLAKKLVKQDKLTAYQAKALWQGKSKHLVLGNYEVLDKLGEGGMGMVFKARHRRMDRTVAVKLLSPKYVKNSGAIKRFQQEVRVAAQLSHQNIVSAFDADESKGLHFLVMEYVEGIDLGQYIKTQLRIRVRQSAVWALAPVFCE